jgi:hypothetical protein
LIIINKPDEQKDKELKVSHKWKKDKKKKWFNYCNYLKFF